MKLYIVHSNEVLPYESTYNKIELVTKDKELAKSKMNELFEEWKKDRAIKIEQGHYEIETSDDELLGFESGDYNNDHYQVNISEYEFAEIG